MRSGRKPANAPITVVTTRCPVAMRLATGAGDTALTTVPGRAACRAATDTVDLRMAVLNAGFGSTGPMHRQDREREVRMVDLNWTERASTQVGRIVGPVARDGLVPFLHQRYDDLSVLGGGGDRD